MSDDGHKKKHKKEKDKHKHKHELKEKKRHRGDESDEERASRKASKRVEKVAKLLGYSNEVNPFGDSNLLQPFVWGKKQEKDAREGRDTTKETEALRLKTMEEIDRVRKRREDREREVEEMERLRTEEQRLRDTMQYGDWQSKEEEFLLEQTRTRSKIRIAESREQPIDTIAKNILLIESCLASEGGRKQEQNLSGLRGELRDPSKVIFGLNAQELEVLLQDIDTYLQLEVRRAGPYTSFWTALRDVASSEHEALLAGTGAQAGYDGTYSAVHKAVEEDVKALLRGKTASDLVDLEAEITGTLSRGEHQGADVAYWQRMKKVVGVQRALLVVTDTHHALLQKQMEALARIQAEGAGVGASSSSSSSFSQAPDDEGQEREFGESEEKMDGADELELLKSGYAWQDQYKPRKPNYFNRVRTGWDWNKYNQTHYDPDSPPPRMVQGYKFAIFYPDLIDKSVAPKYFLEAADSPEFAILRFHAGPPYEDVAFKIINKEWAVHRKSGFKVAFARGVLELHFNFKRSFYRR